MINQILPTAVVFKTGYWPFFSRINGNPVCICERFCIICKHKRNIAHWIDMTELEENSFYFKHDSTLHVKPTVKPFNNIFKNAHMTLLIRGARFQPVIKR